MRSPLFELIAMQATQPNTGAAPTIAPGSGTTTLQIRYSTKRPKIRQQWTKNQTAGFFQAILNSQHDTTRNYRFNVAAATMAFQLAWDLPSLCNPNETIVPTLSGSNVASDVETACILMEYEELGGMEGAYIGAKELADRFSGIQTTVDMPLTGAAAGWTGAAAIDSVTRLLRAGEEYAVLGITTDVACAAVAIQGPCTGNYRFGFPGDTTQIERQHQLYKLASALSGTPMIPVLNASDAGSTQLSFLQDENNITPNVTLHLALLKKG